ncbi:MAG TPA: N-6 DNA methylase [Gemmatimonadaceae bacterium]|nr:N-6 DNA methylase [Gemmatimonadaceae bacterium]
MKTLERAASLLRDAISVDGLEPVFGELGLPSSLLPLDASSIAALGLPAEVRVAKITQGPGALRGLALDISGAAEPRDTLTRVANALSRSAAQLLWIVIAVRQAARELTVVCWRSANNRVRVASLVCRIDQIVQSDAETLCMLSAVTGQSDLLTHARWLDVLGREAITGRFFRTLEKTLIELAASLSGRITPADRRELALLYLSRLVFLSFLESKGWLNGDFCFLSNTYADCIANRGNYQRRVLEPLFFGTLNTRLRARSSRAKEFGRIPFLNGGLFARSPIEKKHRARLFSDEAFGNAFGDLLTRYRFSGREDTTDWSEASIDPEILGKAFEALMATGERKRSGAYYTPQSLVESLTEHALETALQPSSTKSELDRLRELKIIDPACGSGGFLVHLLERLSARLRALGEDGSIAQIRRRVLSSSIFGVDVNPTAVWLCELRLWLSIVIESQETDPMRVAPLPNLDRHIRVGDSLAAGSFDDRGTALGSRKLATLRTRYMRAVGPRKRTLARELDRLERASAIDVLLRRRVRLTVDRKEMLLFLRGRDLFGLRHPPDRQTQLRLAWLRGDTREIDNRILQLRLGAALPFSFDAHFPDIAAAGGFDVVIGNPPWVRIHQIDAAGRQKLRQEFRVYRNAAWRRGAEQAGAGRGFAAQVDLAALFVERACGLVKGGGVIAYLLPTKLWRSLAGGGVRELLLDHTDIVLIEDLSEAHREFDAAVYPSLLVARKRTDHSAPQPAAQSLDYDNRITLTVRTTRGGKRWHCSARRLSIDGPGSPWLLLPGAVRKAFDRVTRAGVPLRVTPFGRPQLGVKTGCNDAYIVRVDSVDDDIARISTTGRTGDIERTLLRPVVRGETLGPWKIVGQSEYIVWPYGESGQPLRELPRRARAWFEPFRDVLIQRTDLHESRSWWSLFRTEGAAFNEPRVIWADFGLRPRAMVLADRERFVPLNTCYVVHIERIADACALAAILNGPLATAWLNAIAEPARGGYRRYLGWTMAMLPIPARWGRVRKALAPLGERAMEGEVPSDAELLEAALYAYRLKLDKVQPLLDWGIACD